jgi:hypothetical protein
MHPSLSFLHQLNPIPKRVEEMRPVVTAEQRLCCVRFIPCRLYRLKEIIKVVVEEGRIYLPRLRGTAAPASTETMRRRV